MQQGPWLPEPTDGRVRSGPRHWYPAPFNSVGSSPSRLVSTPRKCQPGLSGEVISLGPERSNVGGNSLGDSCVSPVHRCVVSHVLCLAPQMGPTSSYPREAACQVQEKMGRPVPQIQPHRVREDGPRYSLTGFLITYLTGRCRSHLAHFLMNRSHKPLSPAAEKEI